MSYSYLFKYIIIGKGAFFAFTSAHTAPCLD